MYGMVNKAVEEMVLLHHDEATWNKIKARAGVDVEVFIGTSGYPDEMTYKLVGAASEVLGIPAGEILHAFGEHWILHTARKGYGSLMSAGGRTLPEFLKNLPNFHDRIALMFPKLQPPRFECSDFTANSLHLHYMTNRPGLTSFMIGLVSGLGKMFNTPVTTRLVQSKEAGAEHDVFEVTWSDALPA
jgi:hypothetical protein